jgi:serine/threonine protein kinase
MLMQAQNRVGQTLGNYRLVKLLGKGGYSEVYLAENIHLGVQAAIKVLKLHNLDDLEQEKFRSEAKFMTTLENQRIIKVLDYGIEMSQRGHGDGSTPYIVMEYAPLGTLRHLYPHRTPMPLNKVVFYTNQMAEALQYAHDKNIIHLDVKPENMLVRKPDDVALSDFGIAVAGMNTSNLQLQQAEILRKMALGQQINIPGTAPYLAPERLLGHTQRASDQYSLGIVVYEWLTGRRPFEGSDLEICQKHERQTPPPLHSNYPYISPGVEEVVMKALAKMPADRYKSVRDFAQALDSAIKASQPAHTPNIPSTLPSPPLGQTPPITPALNAPFPAQPLPSGPIPVPNNKAANTPLYPQVPGANIGNPPIAPWHGASQAGANMGASPWPTNQYPQPRPGPQGTTPPPLWPGGQQQQTSTSQWQQQQPFGYADATVSNMPSGTSQPARPAKDIPTLLEEFFDDPATKTKEIFVVDRHFPNTNRSRQFLLMGVPANILSAFILLIGNGFITHAVPSLPIIFIVAILGTILSNFLLWRCIISVKKPIAIAFAVGVALWWSYVIAFLIPDQGLAILGVLFTIGISLAIHLYYINTRLRD